MVYFLRPFTGARKAVNAVVRNMCLYSVLFSVVSNGSACFRVFPSCSFHSWSHAQLVKKVEKEACSCSVSVAAFEKASSNVH